MRTARLIPWLALAMLAGAGETPPGERITYLGIATSAAPSVLLEQMKLPPGVGLVIDSVDPDSPAARAGLAVRDVVTRFDDQLLVNAQQLGVLVRLHRGGETVKLAVARRDGPATLTATLGEHAAPPAEEVVRAVPRGGRLRSIITHTDAEHSITLTTHGDNDRHVRIVDSAGWVVYDGPLNTPEDAAALPPACRTKVEAIERNFESYKQSHATTTPTR